MYTLREERNVGVKDLGMDVPSKAENTRTSCAAARISPASCNDDLNSHPQLSA